MFKKFRFLLIILGLAIVMIILLPSAPALENINATPNNATAKVSNVTSNEVSFNNETNRSSPIKNSSVLYTSPIANGTEAGQATNATEQARYSFKLGSASHKPVKDLEKVVFICNIM
jgi:hypothetical protein